MDIQKRLLWALMPMKDGSTPVLMVGISRGCYDRLNEGFAQDIDLTSIGVPVRLALFSGETYEDCQQTIENVAAERGITILDERRKDFSIPPEGDPRRK